MIGCRSIDRIDYSVCVQAEQQLQKKGKGQPGEMLEKAAEQLMSCFRVCASDKSVNYTHRVLQYLYTQCVHVLHTDSINTVIFLQPSGDRGLEEVGDDVSEQSTLQDLLQGLS